MPGDDFSGLRVLFNQPSLYEEYVMPISVSPEAEAKALQIPGFSARLKRFINDQFELEQWQAGGGRNPRLRRSSRKGSAKGRRCEPPKRMRHPVCAVAVVDGKTVTWRIVRRCAVLCSTATCSSPRVARHIRTAPTANSSSAGKPTIFPCCFRGILSSRMRSKGTQRHTKAHKRTQRRRTKAQRMTQKGEIKPPHHDYRNPEP